MVRLLILALTLALPTLAQAETPMPAEAQTFQHGWQLLMKSGCDIKARRIHTPIGARVLRNAAYAMQGHVFKAAELTQLFLADGGWYRPNPAAKPTFKKAALACIRKLKQHEAKLRTRLKWRKGPEEIFVTGRQNLVHGIRFRMRMSEPPLGSYAINRDTDAGKPVFEMHMGYSFCDGKPKDPINPCDNPADSLLCSANGCEFFGAG